MRESERVLAATIDTDIAGLADIYLSGGPDELRRRVGDRIALYQSEGERPFYLIAGPDGRRQAGNIAGWPPLSAERSQFGLIAIEGGGAIVARATLLPGDIRIVVGRSVAGRNALLRRIAVAFAAAGILAALLSLAAGWWSGRRVSLRIEGINRAFDAIEAGAIGARAPGDDRRDELGALARHTNRMLAEIERLIAAHRDVSDHTAHEVRTPLTHLDSALRAALGRTVDPEMQAMLAAARGEIRRLIQLLDSLLDIAGAEARKGDVRGLAAIDLSEIADGLADLYEGSAEELGLAFSSTIERNVTMRGDPMQMTRLISNLLDNAFKYVPRGGSVRLAVARGPRVEVADDGPGLAEADRTHAFDRYWRSGGGEGHGLGLALARAIAERHGLLIRVEDAGPGARFIVEPGS